MDYSDNQPPEQPQPPRLEIQDDPPEAPDPNEPYPPRRRTHRDTVVLYNSDTFISLGIKNMPLGDVNDLAEIISNNFGIHVGENKITLVTGRVHPILEKHGFASHRDYINALRADTSGELMSELANRISTNHTAFFREEAHFKVMTEKVLPELVRRKAETRDRDLRIWSAACSTGEEPYTILFTLLKYFHFDYVNWRAGVLATDISASALATAKRGLYSAQKIAPIPADVRNLFFRQVDKEQYEVKPEYREEITFRRLNLVGDIYPFREKFDIIFCRNVMIYFSRDTRTRLLDHLRDWLKPGGYLFIGHSESMVGTHSGFESVAPAVYMKVEHS